MWYEYDKGVTDDYSRNMLIIGDVWMFFKWKTKWLKRTDKKSAFHVTCHVVFDIYRLYLSFKSLKPDPILKLRRIVGFGGSSNRDVSFNVNLSSVNINQR